VPPRRNPFDFFGTDTEYPEDWPEGRKHAGGNGNGKHPFGDALRQFQRGDQGTILDNNSDSHEYVVALDHGGVEQGVARIIQDTSDKAILPIGTRVAVTYDYGPAMIAGILPFTGDTSENENRTSLTGESGAGGNDPLVANKGIANYRTKNTPRDLQAGDWAKVSDDGNAIAVLAGGVNMMKSGMAQVRTHAIGDLVEIICRNYKLITDMGISEIKNSGGKVSWSFRGGSDQLTEVGSDQENWAFRVDLGGSGDMFRFELTQPGGETLFRFNVNNDGQGDMFFDDGLVQFIGSDKLEQIIGHAERTVGNTDTIQVTNGRKLSVGTNHTVDVGGSEARSIGNDLTTSVVRNRTDTVGGKHEENIVGGNPLLAKPGDVARETTINGTWEINIGNPVAGANVTALPSYKLNTFTGDIKQMVTVKGNILNQTTVGNVTYKTLVGDANLDGTRVLLGNTLTAPFNPVLKGNVHNSAMRAWLTTRDAPMTPYIIQTQTLAGLCAPGLNTLYAIPVVGATLFFITVMPIWFAKLQTEAISNAARFSADQTLQGVLQTFLSLKVFTE
jgi:hypothetical protein